MRGIFKKIIILIGFISLFLVVNESPSYSYTLPVPNSSLNCADNVVAPLTTTKDIQTWLSCNGFNPGPIDGAPGARTTAAVKSFQYTNGLSADGVVGPATRRAMRAYSSVTFTFSGSGWGHGVGLCQIGALGMALSGRSSEEILKHYFSSITITKYYD